MPSRFGRRVSSRASGADGAATMARRPRPQDGAAWVPLEGDLGERPGRVTPNVGACPPGRGGRTFGAGGGGCGTAGRARRRRGRGVAASPSRDDLQAEGLGRTARLVRRPASRRGSRARRHRRSRRCARRRVGGHGPRLRGQSVSPPPPRRRASIGGRARPRCTALSRHQRSSPASGELLAPGGVRVYERY